MRFTLVLLFVVSCVKSVPFSRTELSSVPPTKCFDVSFILKGESEVRRGRACYDDMYICERANKAARKYGRLAYITSVTECGEVK